MKKILFFISALFLVFNLSLTNVSAESTDESLFGTPEQLKEQELQFEKILKEIPDGVYINEENSSGFQLFASPSSYKAKPGDVLYTPSTQCKDANKDICKGITGHTGIVHPSTLHVIHIQAPGHKPTVINLSDWFKKYPKTIVVRHNDSTKAKNASNWANNYYGTGKPGSKKTYKVTYDSDLTKTLNLSTTYCSLIVWQAYYFGANQHLSLGIPVTPVGFVNFASYHNMTNYMKIGY